MIKWKNTSGRIGNSWELVSNLNCADLLEKFRTEEQKGKRVTLPSTLLFEEFCLCDDLALIMTLDKELTTWTHKSVESLLENKETIQQHTNNAIPMIY